MIALAWFVCGVLFAIGLGISGMTQPAKVIGFLNPVGGWDPSLRWLWWVPLQPTFPEPCYGKTRRADTCCRL